MGLTQRDSYRLVRAPIDQEENHMSESQWVGDLEISHELGLHHQFWVLQRFGWLLIVLIVLGAIMGLFGSGLLSQTVAGQQNSALWVEYERFWRMKSPMLVRVYFGPAAIRKGQRMFG